jgi:topoisomerase-4 subunit A
LAYDRQKGYIGYKVGGDPLLSCSPLDRLLMIWKDGRCKVVAPPEKLFVDTTLLYCALVDRDRLMTVVYDYDFFCHVKRFPVGGLVTNRESRVAPKGSSILCLADDSPGALFVRYAADPRVKIRQQVFKIERLPVRPRDARGLVLTANRIEYVGAEKPADWDESLTGPPGRISDLG